MLQQTQVSRVVPKYLSWFERFPDALSLAQASLADAYEAWRGLGYNRRAVWLRDAARLVTGTFSGMVPPEEASLRTLPGVGVYTARAVGAFAFDIPSVFFETNIRSAFIFHFFHDRDRVKDDEIAPVAQAALDRDDPRSWYYALMDYGASIKKLAVNPSRKSAAYAKQSGFSGSVREARGAVLAVLADSGPLPRERLWAATGMDDERLDKALSCLVAEGVLRYGHDSDGHDSYGFAD